MPLSIDRMLNALLTCLITCLLKLLLKFESREKKLERAEEVLLKTCRRFYEEKFITVEDVSIRTVIFNPGVPNRPPLVLLHGLDSGLCSFLYNVKRLSRNCTVYAIDLPGFARSSKPHISGDVEDIERKYVTWLELWRQEMAIEKFFILGHDFGGYIATLYALSYPWRVCHLMLYEPWGFPILPFGISDRSSNKKSSDQSEIFPRWLFRLDKIFYSVQRLNFVYRILCFYIRQLLSLAKLIRQPFRFIQGMYTMQEPFQAYAALCRDAQSSSGRCAYRQLSLLSVWAKDPLIRRIYALDQKIPIAFIFGSKSWFDHPSAYEVKFSRSNQDSVEVYVIEGEGNHIIHHENPREFETIILRKIYSYTDLEEKDEGWIEDDWISCDYSGEESSTHTRRSLVFM